MPVWPARSRSTPVTLWLRRKLFWPVQTWSTMCQVRPSPFPSPSSPSAPSRCNIKRPKLYIPFIGSFSFIDSILSTHCTPCQSSFFFWWWWNAHICKVLRNAHLSYILSLIFYSWAGGRHDPAMLSTVASLGVPIVMMHMRGNPQTMTSAEHCTYKSGDCIAEIASGALMTWPDLTWPHLTSIQLIPSDSL